MRFWLVFLLLPFFSAGAFAQYLPPTPRQSPCTRLFPDVKDAYRIRINMIASAEKEVLMSYYYFEDADKPFYILALLQELRQRGVKVKMIVDAMSTQINESALQYLEEQGLEIKIYNPVRFSRILRMDRRLHDKYIIIDRQYLLVGGRNIAAKYFEGNLNKKGSFYDIDAFFEGLPAEEAAGYFDKRWESDWVERPRHKYKRFDPAIFEDIQVQTLAQIAILKSDTVRATVKNYLKSPCRDAHFVANDPYLKRRNRPVEDEHIALVNNAKKEILIQNGYILFTSRMRRALKRALARGVRVQVIANSLQSVDIPISYAAYMNVRHTYMDKGVQFYEFLHNQTMHAKIMVVDSAAAIIGSFNLDPRSAYRNSETAVVVRDTPAVYEVLNYFYLSRGFTNRIMANRKPEGYDEKYPNAGFQRRFAVHALRFTIAPLIRSFL